MDDFILIGWLVVLSLLLLVLHFRNNTHRQEIYDLQNYQATAAQATLNTVENNISSAIKGATDSTKAELITTHKALITKTAEAHKKEMKNRTVELTGKVKAFEQHTMEYFKVNLDDHLTKAESRIDALEMKKDELETCLHSELADYREYDRQTFIALTQTGIIFNKLPTDSDDTFDYYISVTNGTIHKVPKKFDHWKVQPETVQIDRIMAAVYVNEDTNDKIEIPIALLSQIQNPEPRHERNKTSSSIQTPDQKTTDLLTCPVCEKELTSLQYTLQHIKQKQDVDHVKYRADNPGYADHLTAAIEEENYAPRMT